MLGYSDASPLEGSDLVYKTPYNPLKDAVPRATRAKVLRQSELYLQIYLLEEQQ